MTKWNKERDDETGIIWRNIKDPSITVEAHFDDGEFMVEEDAEPEAFWYAFTGENGRGKESSPYMRDSKKEIISVVAGLKRDLD